MKKYSKNITSFLTQFFFGVRIEGEKLKKPTFKTVTPPTQPSQFDWFQEFRVSSLHNVKQNVCL